MTEDRVRFETGVSRIWGYWPPTPYLWSYSSLKELEACPRRWMLTRADYPDLWSKRGYPGLPVPAALFGNVVHGVVERLTQELGDAGITSPTASEVVLLLGRLGGWRGIVVEAIDRELSRFAGNPRVSADRLDRLRDLLIQKAPIAADQVKGFLRHGALPGANRSTGPTVGGDPELHPPRSPVTSGSHSERLVTSEDVRLTGRIDLLIADDVDVTVIDFKTGEVDEDHDDQVLMYALLWDLDRQSNPDRRAATRLLVAYPSHVRSIAVPSETQLRELQREVEDRIAAADATTRADRPVALPSEATCQFCQVKHLCDSYWAVVPARVTETAADEWLDVEARAIRPSGSRSWYVETTREPIAEVLVRTVETNVAFPRGEVVRFLGVRRTIDPDDESRLVVSMAAMSESYEVVS